MQQQLQLVIMILKIQDLVINLGRNKNLNLDYHQNILTNHNKIIMKKTLKIQVSVINLGRKKILILKYYQKF